MNRNIMYCLSLIVLLGACGGDGEMGNKQSASIQDVTTENWQQLGKKRILFGHQSVGNNIIKGIESLIKENAQIELDVIETKAPEDFKRTAFYHFKVGENFDPGSKDNDFSSLLDSGIGKKVDTAFYKYCYVDINETAAVTDLFSSYKENMNSLKNKYPDVNFVHVTVPLVVVQLGPRAWVKKVIGQKIGGYDDNIKRNEFNALMKIEYEGKEPIFDLARIESTYPDGRRMTFTKKGETYFALVPDNSSDGRHLNEKGSRFVAAHLLKLLAELEN